VMDGMGLLFIGWIIGSLFVGVIGFWAMGPLGLAWALVAALVSPPLALLGLAVIMLRYQADTVNEIRDQLERGAEEPREGGGLAREE
jgi:hypothetical protein